MFAKYVFIMISIFYFIGDCESKLQYKLKSKREALASPPLVYPFGATLKLLIGCTVPIAMPGRILVYGQNFQFQFPLPQNATVFSNYFNAKMQHRRRRRNSNSSEISERSIAYRIFENEIHRRGGPGKECLKRSICEIAETPLKDNGLVGEIFHVLLTPDYGGILDVDEEYKEAAEAGRRGKNCSEIYSFCPRGFGLLDHVSEIISY